MPIPEWTAADFTSAFLQLLPRGRAWAKEQTDTLAQAVSTLMPTYVRSAARGSDLLRDAFPLTTIELAPEWMETVGLPGNYASLDLTDAAYQQLIAARIASGGGQSVDYFTSFAKTVGYEISITEFSPFRVGDTVGKPLYGIDWVYAWKVNAPDFSISYFQVGSGEMGDPLASWSDGALFGELNRLKPAHTIITLAAT